MVATWTCAAFCFAQEFLVHVPIVLGSIFWASTVLMNRGEPVAGIVSNPCNGLTTGKPLQEAASRSRAVCLHCCPIHCPSASTAPEVQEILSSPERAALPRANQGAKLFPEDVDLERPVLRRRISAEASEGSCRSEQSMPLPGEEFKHSEADVATQAMLRVQDNVETQAYVSTARGPAIEVNVDTLAQDSPDNMAKLLARVRASDEQMGCLLENVGSPESIPSTQPCDDANFAEGNQDSPKSNNSCSATLPDVWVETQVENTLPFESAAY